MELVGIIFPKGHMVWFYMSLYGGTMNPQGTVSVISWM